MVKPATGVSRISALDETWMDHSIQMLWRVAQKKTCRCSSSSTIKWRFPFRHRATPSYHPIFFDWDFTIQIHHLAIGVPRIYGNPQMEICPANHVWLWDGKLKNGSKKAEVASHQTPASVPLWYVLTTINICTYIYIYIHTMYYYQPWLHFLRMVIQVSRWNWVLQAKWWLGDIDLILFQQLSSQNVDVPSVFFPWLVIQRSYRSHGPVHWYIALEDCDWYTYYTYIGIYRYI